MEESGDIVVDGIYFDDRIDLHVIANGTLIAVRYWYEILRESQTLCWCSGPWIPP